MRTAAGCGSSDWDQFRQERLLRSCLCLVAGHDERGITRCLPFEIQYGGRPPHPLAGRRVNRDDRSIRLTQCDRDFVVTAIAFAIVGKDESQQNRPTTGQLVLEVIAIRLDRIRIESARAREVAKDPELDAMLALWNPVRQVVDRPLTPPGSGNHCECSKTAIGHLLLHDHRSRSSLVPSLVELRGLN
jgi:hypothetical protein